MPTLRHVIDRAPVLADRPRLAAFVRIARETMGPDANRGVQALHRAMRVPGGQARLRRYLAMARQTPPE